MAELSTTLSLEDAHDILEVLAVDRHNRAIIDAHRAKERGRR